MSLSTCIVAIVLVGALSTGAAAQPALQHKSAPKAAPRFDARPQIESYGELAFRNYTDAYRAALALQDAVHALIARRDQPALEAARKAWLDARPSYGQSEAFRFYGGPIDAGKHDEVSPAPAGIEGLLNAWPLNEAYIDSVRGNPAAGIVNADTVPITRALLVRKNAHDDEADVTTGYHAIEFLLWGQDFDPAGPGQRSAADFVGDGPAERRRTYLDVATRLLVENLKTLVDAWAPGKTNYRALTHKLDPAVMLRNMLTGIATLSVFELASERLGTALDSGSQEDEQSCFSDSTHADILANAIGVQNVYFGEYADWHGAGIHQLVQAVNPDLGRYLEQRVRATVALAQQLDRPFDQTLASPAGSPRRAKVEALIKALQMQADLIVQAASALGVPIAIGDND